MSRWTAIVPMKQGAARKSRLAAHLSPAQRIRLNDEMTAHVLGVLSQVPAIKQILGLAPEPPVYPGLAWARDQGRGVNAELGALQQDVSPLLVIHGDLPLLRREEVEALLRAAETHGLAIAPDRHGLGTNALAIADGRRFEFAFGQDSARKHQRAAGPAHALVTRAGLAHDIDTPEDLSAAAHLGWAGSPSKAPAGGAP